MDKIKKISQQTLWQIISKVVSSLSTLLVLGIITRNYGEAGTGIFTLSITYLAFFFLAADLGLNAYVLPRLKENPDEANKLFSARFYWSIILVFLANILALLLPFKEPLFNQSVFLGSIMIVFSGIFNSANLIFQRNLRYDLSMIASSLGTLMTVPLTLFLTSRGLSVNYVILGSVGGWFAISLFALILVRKLSALKLTRIDFSFIIKSLKVAWPLSATLLLNVVYFRVDAFMLSSFKSFTDVGVYNIAYSVFQSALVLPTFIMNAYFPIMVRLLQENRKVFFDQLKTASLLMLLLGVLGTLATLILADSVINLVAGDSFQGASKSLRILSLGFPAYFLSSVLMWVFVTLKRYKVLVAVYLIGLLVNIILNYIFIPRYSYIASSWITGISEYLILILQIGILWKVINSR